MAWPIWKIYIGQYKFQIDCIDLSRWSRPIRLPYIESIYVYIIKQHLYLCSFIISKKIPQWYTNCICSHCISRFILISMISSGYFPVLYKNIFQNFYKDLCIHRLHHPCDTIKRNIPGLLICRIY